LTIDGGPEAAIETDGEVRFELPPRKYQLALSTLDARCVVGTPRREVEVMESYPSLVQFQVRCYPTAPSLAGDKLVVSYKSLLGSGLDAMNPDGTVRFPIEESTLGAGDAAVSVDGRRLAFRRFAAVGSNLVVLDVATGTKSVSPAAMRISSLSWSPDGQQLVTGLWNNDIAGLTVIRADGSVERDLGQNDGAALTARWAPDGTRIAFTRNGHDVKIVNADGSNVRTLVSSSERYFDGGEWSADSRTLLVRSYRHYCYYYSWYCYTFDARLVVLDGATGREIRTVSMPEYAFGFVWGSSTAEVYWIQAGDVFYSRLDPFAPVNVTRSPEDEWSVLWGHFEGGTAAAVRSARSEARKRK
jgi:dipeptidyl aminopeptidase/acylaminoacyl peptidase